MRFIAVFVTPNRCKTRRVNGRKLQPSGAVVHEEEISVAFPCGAVLSRGAVALKGKGSVRMVDTRLSQDTSVWAHAELHASVQVPWLAKTTQPANLYSSVSLLLTGQ